jgi:hypothetical protein
MEEWNTKMLLEVELDDPDDFLRIMETLTRIGIPSKEGKTLYQSCHILHKQGRYFVVSFKEMFKLDGKESNISEEDIQRRDTIASLLSDWGLLRIVSSGIRKHTLSNVKVITHKEKRSWTLISKYQVGKCKSRNV